MLLNCSNHPFEKWASAQQDTALDAYGDVEDLPFPQIDPAATEAAVGTLADEYAEKIAAFRPAAVHLMGEATFTFALVHRLQQGGIICIASTTERIVEDHGESRTVRFQFVQFRKYIL